jgi:hypothetical protein
LGKPPALITRGLASAPFGLIGPFLNPSDIADRDFLDSVFFNDLGNFVGNLVIDVAQAGPGLGVRTLKNLVVTAPLKGAFSTL